VLLKSHEPELKNVKTDQDLHWEGVGPQKIEVVVEAACVEWREDEVAALNELEAESVMELPAGVREEVRDDLGHPEKSEQADCLSVVRHDALAEDDDEEGDAEDDDDQVRLFDLQLLGCGRPNHDIVKGNQLAKHCYDGQDLTHKVDERHSCDDDQVQQEALERP